MLLNADDDDAVDDRDGDDADGSDERESMKRRALSTAANSRAALIAFDRSVYCVSVSTCTRCLRVSVPLLRALFTRRRMRVCVRQWRAARPAATRAVRD
jgi:hypothetical protein